MCSSEGTSSLSVVARLTTVARPKSAPFRSGPAQARVARRSSRVMARLPHARFGAAAVPLRPSTSHSQADSQVHNRDTPPPLPNSLLVLFHSAGGGGGYPCPYPSRTVIGRRERGCGWGRRWRVWFWWCERAIGLVGRMRWLSILPFRDVLIFLYPPSINTS